MKKMDRTYLNVNCILLLGLGLVSHSWAALRQDIPPIQVRAEGNIQIFLKKKCCIMEKNVCLTQNGMTISCQKMKVFFKESMMHKNPKIEYIIAIDNVVVKRDQSELFAEVLVLNVTDQILTASPKKDSFVHLYHRDQDVSIQARHVQYRIRQHCGTASGCATLHHTRGNLRAHQIHFLLFDTQTQRKTSSSKLAPQTSTILARAEGNVLIIYDEWKSASRVAVYDQKADKIILSGNVRVEKGKESFGQTQCAILDLKRHRYYVKSAPGQSSIFLFSGKIAPGIKQSRRR